MRSSEAGSSCRLVSFAIRCSAARQETASAPQSGGKAATQLQAPPSSLIFLYVSANLVTNSSRNGCSAAAISWSACTSRVRVTGLKAAGRCAVDGCASPAAASLDARGEVATLAAGRIGRSAASVAVRSSPHAAIAPHSKSCSSDAMPLACVSTRDLRRIALSSEKEKKFWTLSRNLQFKFRG